MLTYPPHNKGIERKGKIYFHTYVYTHVHPSQRETEEAFVFISAAGHEAMSPFFFSNGKGSDHTVGRKANVNQK